MEPAEQQSGVPLGCGYAVLLLSLLFITVAGTKMLFVAFEKNDRYEMLMAFNMLTFGFLPLAAGTCFFAARIIRRWRKLPEIGAAENRALLLGLLSVHGGLLFFLFLLAPLFFFDRFFQSRFPFTGPPKDTTNGFLAFLLFAAMLGSLWSAVHFLKTWYHLRRQ